MRFSLGIDLGNDAMRTSTDVAAALRKVADDIAVLQPTGAPIDRPEDAVVVGIRDSNGNSVGYWSVNHGDTWADRQALTT